MIIVNIEITKDSDKMLGFLYKTFLSRRKDGLSKQDARRFSDDFFSKKEPFASMNSSDINDARLELARSGLLKNYIYGDCELTDRAIVYLENRFKNGFAEVVSFLAQFIP